MKNLFQFLWRNNYTIFFVLLEALSISLIVRNNHFQNATAFNSSNYVVGSVMEMVSNIREYISLKTTNRYLAGENARLRTLLSACQDASGFDRVNTVEGARYQYTPCRVINNSVYRQANYLTLDKGSLDGITEEMGVISSLGVVGIVKNVSPHFSTVMSLLHKDASISARFRKNNYFGPLSWDGDDPGYATLRDIARHVKITVGDTIVTTSYSSIFPADIPIGTVASYEAAPGENFYAVRVKLATDFRNLDYVYVIHNILGPEQLELEEKSEADDS
jgi:rod shape-determining protein MreC